MVACQLSGMPDLTLTFVNPSVLADAALHRCVRANVWASDRIISCVPPDGHFPLLNYRSALRGKFRRFLGDVAPIQEYGGLSVGPPPRPFIRLSHKPLGMVPFIWQLLGFGICGLPWRGWFALVRERNERFDWLWLRSL